MNFQKNVPLAPYTTFHIGGPADLFIIVHSSDELVEAVEYSRKNNIDFFVLGQGANILVGDRGFRGLVIKNEANKVSVKRKALRVKNSVRQSAKESVFEKYHSLPFTLEPNLEDYITAESGITIAELIKKSAELGLSGLEHFAGIPSSLGGALWQNLHFLSADRSSTIFISDVIKTAEILTESGEVKEVDKEYFQFGYDYSILHDTRDVVLSATLLLKRQDRNTISKTIEANLAWRKEKHPEKAWKTSAGSVFKKIEGHGAGRLIEQVGLKGKRIGGAEISEKHANFIINTGDATAKDVRDLIHLVQEKVKTHKGLVLETEISFVGEFNDRL